MNTPKKRTVFFISDGTGITAETLGHSLLTQFDKLQFENITYPYIDTLKKAQSVLEHINRVAAIDGQRPLIFATLANPEIHQLFSACKGLLLDFFATFIHSLEKELHTKSSHHVGRSHSVLNYDTYKARIDAVNYALGNDDGANIHNFADADLILVGVSRCGKTPTCLYLALKFGVSAANYPFTQDDMDHLRLPDFLRPYRSKLFGLSIDAKRLHNIRTERRPNSRYASLEQCQLEVRKVEELFLQEKIPFVDATKHSIEEISTTVLAATGINRQSF